jgi:hypothetical protein
MSEADLRKFVERLNSDDSYREKVGEDIEAVLDEYELSAAELAAVGTGDEDALRRLLSAEVSGFAVGQADLFGSLFWCTPPNGICITSGSRRDCGTGGNCGTAGSGRGCGTGDNCRLP